TITSVLATKPVTVKVCSAVVLAATLTGVIAAVSVVITGAGCIPTAPKNRYVSAAVGVMIAAVAFRNVIPTVLVVITRASTMPRPACVVGLLTAIAIPGTTPVTVNCCSAVVFT